MEKNWLIRTKNNHILGPVSKEKIKRLIESNTINPDDEVCSGNGYWFFIREQDLVDKYIFGETPQEFNPVSEADTVLANKTHTNVSEIENVTKNTSEDITLVGKLTLDDLDVPFDESNSLPVEEKPKEILDEPRVEDAEEEEEEEEEEEHSFPKINLLYIIAIALFIFAISAFYFRRNIIQNFIESNISNSIISPAIAQITTDLSQKKKSY